jgi:hypothetical protein
VGLWVAVQQQYGRPGSAHPQAQVYVPDVDEAQVEASEHAVQSRRTGAATV